MSRSLLLVLFIASVLGCQGQSNPFMRTTVPPPATGVGAPTDPYYNNSGRSQPPAASSTAVPAPVQTAPVVPPPDKRFTQPGGFNFPQGSILHRKAIDPTADDYRTGTSSIARAARPRSMLGGEHPVQIAAADAASTPATIEPDESAHAAESADTVVQASATEASLEEPTEELPEESPPDESARAIAVTEPQPEFVAEPASPATSPPAAAIAERGSATVRIVAAEEGASSGTDVANAVAAPNDSKSPFVAVTSPSTSLTVAPPTAASTAPAEGAMAATAGTSAEDAAGRTRFYFDRKHELHPSAKAQAVAYLGTAGSGVAFAGGASGGSGGVDGGPEGASAYSYHSQYQWLRGKLEYSSAAKRWKLRYIPIDGTTDPFGGSVVLAASPLLEAMQAGEMVTVRGTIGETPYEHGRFAPLYQMSALERQ